ncbi:MAG TPA: hypothetical protein VGI81_18690 [Tepidisphaeraceae bacterium]|jgi:hypothetical protein
MDMTTMSENAAAFTRMWAEMATQMMAASMSFNPTSPPPEASRQVRGAMFDSMARQLDEFMRSPQFLQLTKQWTDWIINSRIQLNDWLTGLRHDTQGTAREDIDNVMVSISHLETRMLDRMEMLAARLDAISTRLDSGANNGHKNTAGKASALPTKGEKDAAEKEGAEPDQPPSGGTPGRRPKRGSSAG